MHRSGTSMVAGVLHHLGVDLGEDLPGKQVSNPLGHYEDGDFLQLNERILASAGGSWDRPPDSEAILSQGAIFQEEIQALIASRKAHNQERPWGWKDPRTSIVAELYLPYLENPHLIWCLRPPHDIAASLQARNRIHLQAAEQITAIYHRQIEELLDRHPELPLLKMDYNQLVSSPQNGVDQLIHFLDLNPSQGQIEEAISQILPRKRLEQEKSVLRWKYWLSLPLRAFRRWILRN
jgi:hypothetical protein